MHLFCLAIDTHISKYSYRWENKQRSLDELLFLRIVDFRTLQGVWRKMAANVAKRIVLRDIRGGGAMIIHKKGLKKVERYLGLGSYNYIPTPICVGAKGLYGGKSYTITNFWKDVTCKHCLKKKNRQNNLDKPRQS